MDEHITQEDVIYFVVTDRFYGKNKRAVSPADSTIHGGTLDGILEKLDYLKELGITAIWVTPVYENIPSRNGSEPYHYYWAQNFNAMDPRLLDGTHLPCEPTMATFQTFVTQCKVKGFKVVLDMVINHCGYGAQGGFPPEWFNINGTGDVKGELAGLPDFNHDNPNVVDFFINNIQDWIEIGGITNIRMDTVKHVEKKFWYYFASQIRGEYADTFLLGEVLLEGKNEVGQLVGYQNYHDLDSIFDFPLCTALRSTLIYDDSLREWLARPRLNDNEIPGLLDNDDPRSGGYRNPNSLVTLLDNHDLQRRIMSHARTKHAGTGAGLVWAIRVTKLCLGALFTIRGIPQLYYGTEIGLEGWKAADDADLRRDFPWEVIGLDQRPLPAYTKESEIYQWCRELIALRKGSAALKYGATITLWSDDLTYAFLRISSDEVALVVINNGYAPMSAPLPMRLNTDILPAAVIAKIPTLKHWQTQQPLAVHNQTAFVQTPAKSIDIFV
jgi:glycosidase